MVALAVEGPARQPECSQRSPSPISLDNAIDVIGVIPDECE
jgi:hypothetical protein